MSSACWSNASRLWTLGSRSIVRLCLDTGDCGRPDMLDIAVVAAESYGQPLRLGERRRGPCGIMRHEFDLGFQFLVPSQCHPPTRIPQ